MHFVHFIAAPFYSYSSWFVHRYPEFSLPWFWYLDFKIKFYMFEQHLAAQCEPVMTDPAAAAFDF